MLLIFLFIIYIVLFISGMSIMRIGLMNIAGEKMKEWLYRATSSTWKGLIFGIIITIILQSSSAVMIIAIGLIAVKLLTFKQSIGIILGTNIGTTATIEFLAYSPDHFIVPLLILGSILILIPKKKVRSSGLFMYGLGAIFLAMYGFERLAEPLSGLNILTKVFYEMNDHTSISILVGTIVTAIIQSSTAMTGIAMGFIQENILSLSSAIAVMLGANIGTCFDAYIASIGGGKEAKLTAFAHVWLNVIGVLIFVPFVHLFAELVGKLASEPVQQLAHASVIFNVAVSLLFLPIAKPFASFVKKIHSPFLKD